MIRSNRLGDVVLGGRCDGELRRPERTEVVREKVGQRPFCSASKI